MAVPRNPITIDTSDTFSTWLSNTNLAINVLKDIITDTVLTHADHSGAAFTAGSTITQATTGATGIVQVSTVDATTISDLGTGTWGTSNNVTQSSPTSVTLTSGHLTAVTTSHLATTGAVLTTPTITAPVIATITNNSNTLTLPTSADTLVGRATTDTLTNKTLTSPAINGGTMTSVTLVTPTLGTVANLTIANAGNIGSVGDTDAMAISSGGVVTFSQRDVHSAGITVADAGQIGSASDTDAIAIGADGDVTLTQDLELQHDSATISLGANDDVIITHLHNEGISLTTTPTSTATGTILHFLNNRTAIGDGDTIGKILFKAPLESSGSDAIASTAQIAVVATEDFDATNNDSAVTFSFANDTTSMAERFRFDSTGNLTMTGDAKLQHDGAVLSFGANDDVTVTHVADTGLTIKNTDTSGNSGVGAVLTLQTGDTDIADGNILGQIKFQAPDEGSGSADQDLVAAGIAARSEGDFSDTSNATELVFNTGLTEDASIGSSGGKMILSSAGLLTIADDLIIKDGGTIGVTSAATAITIASTGIVTLVDDLVIKDGGTIGVTSAATAITIASTGIVTLVDDLVIKDGGTIGVTSAATAITIASSGIVTFVDDIVIKDAGTIGSATDPDAIAIGSDGDITLTQDLELQHDGAILSFGTNDDVTITHVADTGLIIKNTHTSGNSGVGVVLTLQTGDTDIADGNILGQIKFQAPDEGSGAADQDLVAAGIAARSEGDFSDTNNATELVFNTGASEDASIGASGGDMILSSAGNLTVAGTYNGGGIMTTGGNIVIPDAGTIGSATDTDAIAIGSDGDITLTQDLELQHDAATISMGTNDDVVITHIADEGISLETTPTGTTAGTIIHFKNKRTTIADGEMIARLLFQTPSESDGSDAIVSTAEIGVKAIEAFSATANRSAVTFGFADGGTTITEALRIVPEGIKFPGTADLSTDANTLDDYEEGTWTPDMPDGGGEDAISGRYVKIGRQVIATAFINTNTTADYSNFKLTGLPFTILDDDCCGFVSMTSVTSYNYDDGSAPRFFYLTKNTDYIQGWSVSGDALEHSGRNNETYRGQHIMFQAVYETAS